MVTLRERTIYHFLKELAGDMEDQLDAIDDVTEKAARLHEAAQAEAHRISETRRYVREAHGLLRTNEAREAVVHILRLAGSTERSRATKTKCFEHLQTVRREHHGQYGIVPRLQRLIDLSFEEAALGLTFNEHDRCELDPRAAEQVAELQRAEERTWLDIVRVIEEVGRVRQYVPERSGWDFFIAYSSRDANIAEGVHTVLSQVGRTFLDRRCLRPGDRWTTRIRDAQDNSRVSVIVITKVTPGAWYSESEYLHAISLMRTTSHTVVPILYGGEAELPYGLEQVQAIRIDDWHELSEIPGLVKDLVDGGSTKRSE